MQYLIPAILSASGLLANAAPVASGGGAHSGIEPMTPRATRIGGDLVVEWQPDTSGSKAWKNMDIALVAADKSGKKHVQKIASGVDGTSRNKNTYIAKVPSGVTSGEYFVQFSHDGKDTKESHHFDIQGSGKRAASEAQQSASAPSGRMQKSAQRKLKAQHQSAAAKHSSELAQHSSEVAGHNSGVASHKSGVASHNGDIASLKNAIKSQSGAGSSATGGKQAARVAQPSSASRPSSSASAGGAGAGAGASSAASPDSKQRKYANKAAAKNSAFQQSASKQQSAAMASLQKAAKHTKRGGQSTSSSSKADPSEEYSKSMDDVFKKLQSALSPDHIAELSQLAQSASAEGSSTGKNSKSGQPDATGDSNSDDFNLKNFGKGVDSDIGRALRKSLLSQKQHSATGSSGSKPTGRMAQASKGAIQSQGVDDHYNNDNEDNTGIGSTSQEDNTNNGSQSSHTRKLSKFDVLKFLRDEGLLQKSQTLSDKDINVVREVLGDEIPLNNSHHSAKNNKSHETKSTTPSGFATKRKSNSHKSGSSKSANGKAHSKESSHSNTHSPSSSTDKSSSATSSASHAKRHQNNTESRNSTSTHSSSHRSSPTEVPLEHVLKNLGNLKNHSAGFGGPSNSTSTAAPTGSKSHSGASHPTAAHHRSQSASSTDALDSLRHMISNGLLSNTGLSQEQIDRFLEHHAENFRTRSRTYTQDHHRSLSAQHHSHSYSATF